MKWFLCFSAAIGLSTACSNANDSSVKSTQTCDNEDIGSVTFNSDGLDKDLDYSVHLQQSDVGKLFPLPAKNQFVSYESKLQTGYSLCLYDEESGMSHGYRIGPLDLKKWEFAEWFNKKADHYLLVRGESCPSNPSVSNAEPVSCQPRQFSSETSADRKLGFSIEVPKDQDYKVSNYGQVQVRDKQYRWQDMGSGEVYPLCSLGQPKTACDDNNRAWGFENNKPCRNELKDAECK